MSELVKSELPERDGIDNKVLKTRQSEGLVWEFMGNPLPLEYTSAGYGVEPGGQTPQDTRYRTDVMPNNTYYQINGYTTSSTETDFYIQLEDSSVPCSVFEFDCTPSMTTIHVLKGSTELTQVGSEFKPKSSGNTHVQVFIYGKSFIVKTSNLIAGGGGGGGGSNGQIVISYDEATKVATYNGQPITTDAAVALCNDNPNMAVNIFYTDTEEGITYPVGVAPLSRVYPDQGLMFSMQMFESGGSVEEYVIVWATPGEDWDHEIGSP